MSVDMKKKRKKRWVYLVRPARCFSVPLWPLLVPSCVFHRVRRIFDVSWPPRFVLSCCYRWGRLGGISGPFWCSWGIVWRVLALTQQIGDGGGGGSGVGWERVVGGGGGRSDDVSDASVTRLLMCWNSHVTWPSQPNKMHNFVCVPIIN